MRQISALFAVLLISGSLAKANLPPATRPVKKAHAPVIVRITNRLYRVGTAMVDTSLHRVTVNGSLNMASGSVEYLAVTPRGKTYESVLRLFVQPLYLQVALYLAGMHAKNVISYQGQRKTPMGDPMVISVQWNDTLGHQHVVRAEELLKLEPGNRVMPHHAWVFTGSRVTTDGYLADLTGSIVAVWHDPTALIDNPLPTGSDDGWVVNSHVAPPQGTPVTVYFQAISKKGTTAR